MKRTHANAAKVRQDNESGMILAATRLDPKNEERLSDFLDEKMLSDSAKLLSAYGEDLGSLMDMIDIDMPAARKAPAAAAPLAAPVEEQPEEISDSDLQSGIQIGLEDEGDDIQIGSSDMNDIEDLMIGGGFADDEAFEDPVETFSLSNIPESMPDLDLGNEDFDLAPAEESETPALTEVEDVSHGDVPAAEIAPSDDDDFEVVPVSPEQLAVNAQISAHIREDGQDQDADVFEDVLDTLHRDDDIAVGPEDIAVADDGIFDLLPEPEAQSPEPDEVADLSGEIDFSDLMEADDGFEEESETASLTDMLRPSSLPEPKPAGFSEEDDWLAAHMADLEEEDLRAASEADNEMPPVEDDDIPDLTPEEVVAPVRVSAPAANVVDFGDDPLSIMDEEGDDAGESSRTLSGHPDVKSGAPAIFEIKDATEAAEAKDGVRPMGIFGKTKKNPANEIVEAPLGTDEGFDPSQDDMSVMQADDVDAPDADAPVSEADQSEATAKKPRGPMLTVLLGTAVAAVIGLSVFSFLQGQGTPDQAQDRLGVPAPVAESDILAADPTVPADAEAPVTAQAPSDVAVGDIPAAGDVSPSVVNSSEQMQDLDKLAKDLEAAKNGDLSDLFDKEATPAVVLDQGIAVTQDMIDSFATKEQTEEVKKAIDLLFEQLKTVEASVAEKDQRIASLEQALNTTASQAQKAEALALAQNEVLVEFVRVQEKVDMAESLIVDLSKRIAKVETTDPADRVAVERSLDDLNSRIDGMARDIGLIARMSINGSPAAVKSTAGAMSEEPSVPGSGAVYEEAPSNAQPASGGKENIPSNVKVGDFVDGYGYVLDIISTSDGSRLVVMENGSVLIS